MRPYLIGSAMPSDCRVLIVENDDSLREGAAELLEENGYEVLCARDGLEGLATLRQIESGHLPDLILLDLWMPRMDGWQFKAAVKQVPAFAKIPIVVFTADRLSEDVLSIGADDYVVKPPDVEALLTTVEYFCNKRPAATAVAE
jgi:two-component system, chemotaxis family, chemotaxis protein CheY